MKRSEHPSVKAYYKQRESVPPSEPIALAGIKSLCLKLGADDAGIVSIDDKAIVDQRADILDLFPQTQAVISLVCKLNRDTIRCVDRSVSDFEFLNGFEKMGSVSRAIVQRLGEQNIRAVNPPVGFPMDMSRWPGKMWSVSHKPIAVAAGLGVIGHHRLVTHPRFGSFIVLGSILIDQKPDSFSRPLDFDPCLNCKICATVCPVGAVSKDGHFNFANCMTHNYRDRVGGFSDWVDTVVSSHTIKTYRQNVSDSETVSMWQSLSYGICNKSSYCMAVCPAGSDIIGDYLENRKHYQKTVVAPLKNKTEAVYVVPGSDAALHVKKMFPHKSVRPVGNGLRPTSVAGFLTALPLVFQREPAKELNACYHFTFHGREQLKGTVVIKEKQIMVHDGHIGTPDLNVSADSDAWLKFLARDRHILIYLLTRKITFKGPARLLKQFAACFPS